jgi:predicted porin
MKTRIGIFALGVALISAANAADLAASAPSAPTSCFSSFWNWLSASANDCPLTYAGITLYGSLDIGATYLTNGVGYSPSADKLNYFIQKNSSGSKWLPAYNALSQSVLGLKMKENLGYGWSLVGVLEAGINPYSGMFDNGPRSLADNNARPASKFPWQTSNFDSSRAGQWDNSQAYIGVSNPVYGALTFGRTDALAYDLAALYDPAASYAFSMIGFSAAFANFGNTEAARPIAFTYRGTYRNFRAAVQAQVGGYGLGNATNGLYQGQLGGDFGPFSIDGALSWAKDVVSLSSFSGSNIACLNVSNCFINVNNAYYNPNSVLKATLSNNFGAELVAKYKWNNFTLYGGTLYARLSNPSDDYLTGFKTIAQGIFVPAGFFSKGVYTNSAITDNAYNFNKILQTFWTGVKWSVRDNLDLSVAFYYQGQSNYSFNVTNGVTISAPCTGSGPFISSNKCGGSQDAFSFLADWRPFKRVDVYGGVMLSNVYGGLANGFFSTTTYAVPEGKKIPTATVNTPRTQEFDPTVGVRIRF